MHYLMCRKELGKQGAKDRGGVWGTLPRNLEADPEAACPDNGVWNSTVVSPAQAVANKCPGLHTDAVGL